MKYLATCVCISAFDGLWLIYLSYLKYRKNYSVPDKVLMSNLCGNSGPWSRRQKFFKSKCMPNWMPLNHRG